MVYRNPERIQLPLWVEFPFCLTPHGLTGILQHNAVKEPCPHFRDKKIDVKYVSDHRHVRVKTKIQNETLQI